jgi:N-succinyl-L-ornithine transcarbamylase
MKQFLSVNDVTNLDQLIKNALDYKNDPLRDSHLGQGKRIGCIFMNPSLRTRLSTQIAAKNLGLDPILLNAGSEGWALEFEDGAVMDGTTVEHIRDAARVLGRYFDILAVRAFPKFLDKEEDYSEHIIKQFVRYSNLPVISLESATLHPLQSLADLITMTEQRADPQRKLNVVLTWAPHIKSIPHCVANSFAQWVNRWEEANLTITHPKGYELSEEFTKGAIITHDQKEAIQNADFIYVKNWSRYDEYGKVDCLDPNWMLTSTHLKESKSAKIMHCLPVRRNVELSDEVLDSPQSIVADQAENRIWAAQAVLSEILKNG